MAHPDLQRAFALIPIGMKGYVYGSAALLAHPDMQTSKLKERIKDVDLWIQVPDVHDEDYSFLSQQIPGLNRLAEQPTYAFTELTSDIMFLGTVSEQDPQDPFGYQRPIQVFITSLSPSEMLYTADINCHAWLLESVSGTPRGLEYSVLPNAEAFMFLLGAQRNPMDSLMRYVRFSERYGAEIRMSSILSHIAVYQARKEHRKFAALAEGTQPEVF